MYQIITAQYIFDGDCVLKNHAIVIANDEQLYNQKTMVAVINIANDNILHEYQMKYKCKVQDLGDGIISSGFIDLQVNGCGGVLLNDNISEQTLHTIRNTWQQHSTPYFLPTLITSSFDDVILALETVKSWFNKYGNFYGVLGLHLEGPFIAKAKKGIHQEEFIILPQDYHLQQIISYAKYFPIKMTIAPESFTNEQLQLLIQAGIIISIGHSNASYEQTMNAINYGISTTTHIFNAMNSLSARQSGVLSAVLRSDIYAGVITDLLHVDVNNIKLLTKIKPKHTYIVTDSVTPTATNIKQFMLAGKQIRVENGQCLDYDNRLGGAYITMAQSFSNCVKYCDISITNVLMMSTVIPAKVMKLDHIIGYIKPNYLANLIYIDIKNDYYAAPINDK